MKSVATKVIGALVGAEIDRRHGQSALKGAALGAIAAGAMRRFGTVGLVLGGAWAAKKAYDRHRETRPA